MRTYHGKVRCWCQCHGFWAGYTLKIEGLISITVSSHHYPWVWISYGKEAKIVYGTKEELSMFDDRINRS